MATPTKIINRPAQIARGVCVGLGVFFALAALGASNNGDSSFGFIFLSVVSFAAALALKVTWRKKAEAAVYK